MPKIFRKSLLSVVLLAAAALSLLPIQSRAVTLVQQEGNNSTTTAVTTATLNVVLPTHATAGNSLGVTFLFGSSAGTPTLTSITDNQGNTYTINQNNTNTGLSGPAGAATILSLANTPQTISVTVGDATSGNIFILAEVYEVSGATAVDVSTHGTTSNSTALNASFNTVSASEFAFASLSNNTGGTYTQNDGWTQDETATGAGSYTFHNILSSSGANSLNATVSTASYSLWNVITFKGSSAAPFAPILLNDPSHAGGSTQINMGSGPNTGTGDAINVAAPKIIQDTVDLNRMLAQLYPVRSLQTPTTGFSIAAANSVTKLALNPAGTLASGTVTLPQNPGDGQPFELVTSQTITALTVNTADGTTINGAPTTLSNTSGVEWIFVASLNAWYRAPPGAF